MSRIRILHTTTYRYLKPVAFGVHRLVVRPREGHDLQVENLLLRINPPGAVSWHRDIYGNSIALVTFSEPSDLLEFSSEATVFRRDHSAPRGLLDAHPETMPVRYSALEEPLVRAYVQSVFPDEADRLRRWARQIFPLQRGDDAVQSVQEINSWIHRSIRYRRREDRGVQSPLETLARESGSCRDMATLLLEIVRTLKLAGRFASGYLENSASLAGRASTHAWMEVYFPEHGWFGCDPSSGEGTSKKHIVTGVSSHPRGVMPVSGVYSGDPRSFVEMNALVKISPMASGREEPENRSKA